MPSVSIRFYEELNEFLAEERKRRQFTVDFHEGCTAKAVIEDLGVPHTEIDLILANGESVGFDYRLKDGDRLSVFPVFESWDISGVSRVRPSPLRQVRFIIDVHLGKLARLLRMFGFDVLYRNGWKDEELVRTGRGEGRIVLTRDRGLLKRRNVTHGYLVRSLAPRAQLAEVIKRFDLSRQARPFSRCMACNETLMRVEKKDVFSRLPARVAEAHDEFSRCPSCGRLYWRGTHWDGMRRIAEEVLGRDWSPG